MLLLLYLSSVNDSTLLYLQMHDANQERSTVERVGCSYFGIPEVDVEICTALQCVSV